MLSPAALCLTGVCFGPWKMEIEGKKIKNVENVKNCARYSTHVSLGQQRNHFGKIELTSNFIFELFSSFFGPAVSSTEEITLKVKY